MHIDVNVEFMTYVKGIIANCRHFDSIRTKTAKEKMPKLMRIIALWNERCRGMSARAEDQLRSMGDETEWQKFYEGDENPIKKLMMSRPLFDEPEEVELPEPEQGESFTLIPGKGKENAGYQPAAP